MYDGHVISFLQSEIFEVMPREKKMGKYQTSQRLVFGSKSKTSETLASAGGSRL
jgi:hypothetical protein